MKTHIIATIQRDSGMRKDGKNLWSIKEDLERFKRLTKDNTVIAGRKTWELILKKFRPLNERSNIVVTTNQHYVAPGANIACSMAHARIIAEKIGKDLFIMGGLRPYEEAFVHADKLHLIIINGQKPADSFFPKFKHKFKKTKEKKGYDKKQDVEYFFTEWIPGYGH